MSPRRRGDKELTETPRRSPDRVPHVEPVQRPGAADVPPRQADEGRQPVGDVDEFPADGPGSLQQRAGDEPDPPDPSLPQRPLPPAQGPVAAARQRLTAVIFRRRVGNQ